MLEHLRRGALIPERLEAFVHLIKSEMGFRLHEAVRRAKFELSANTETQFEFHCEPVSISKKVTRAEFEKWIEPELSLMAACVDRLLSSTGVIRARHRSRVSDRRIVVRAGRAQDFRRAIRVGEDYGRRRADVGCDRIVALRRQGMAGRRHVICCELDVRSGYAADFSSQREHDCQGQHLRRSLLHRRASLPRISNRSIAVGHAGQRGARAAHPVQPRAPRRGQRHRLPLLPHDRRDRRASPASRRRRRA